MMVFCACNPIEEISSGGIKAGGSALVTVDTVEGGVSLGGCALVSVSPDVWDDFHFVLPLDEAGNGTPDEYRDRTKHNLHGTGGAGDMCPTIDLGVFCQPSQYFDGRDFISIPEDNLDISDGFTISLWVKMERRFEERAFYTRGGIEDDWNFTIGQSYLNHIWARIRLSGDEEEVTHYVFSERLQLETWYHIAVTWIPQSSLGVLVNGIPHATIETPQTSTLASSGAGGYIGRKQAQSLTGNIQEVRLQPVRDEAWLEAEHASFCDAGFVVEGDEEEAVVE